MTYVIQHRDIPWWSGPRYRVVRINADGERFGCGEFFTRPAADRWIASYQWSDLPWTPRDLKETFGVALSNTQAKAWDEGYTSGHSNAMRRMSDEPDAPTTPNPYKAITTEGATS